MYSVYLVDDNPHILESLPKDIPWQENGFEIIGKNCFPKQALNEIAALRPHVVCSDLKMPGMDGIALISRLRDMGLEFEALILSAYSDYSDMRDFFLQHGFDYLLKPPDPMNMQITLERLARRLLVRHRFEDDDHMGHEVTEKEGMAKIDRIMTYISRNFDKKITLDSLGEAFGLSSGYVCSLFTKHYGQPLTVFLTDFRMKEAAKRMEHTDKPLKTIALECGYSNYSYFRRVFKEFYGVPPVEHRETT